MRGRPVATFWALALVAGCLGPSAPPPTASPGETIPAIDLAAIRGSGVEARKLLYDFAMGHPNRHPGMPEAHEAARTYLRSTLAAYGVEVADHAYSQTGTNILGFVRGTDRADEWIVLSCHYDTIESTVYGARDDGLGCAAVLEMARAFADAPWRHTLVFAFFDEEEDGLLGSRAFVQDFAAQGEANVAYNLNFDPAGLHYPCGDAAGPYDVRLFITESKVEGEGAVPGYQDLRDAVVTGFLAAGVPADEIQIDTQHAYLRVNDQEALPPGSDDDSFDAADIPSIWLGSPPLDEVGPVGVWGYPNHTPPDTAGVVEARCGSAALLEEALQVALDATATALVSLEVDGSHGAYE